MLLVYCHMHCKYLNHLKPKCQTRNCQAVISSFTAKLPYGQLALQSKFFDENAHGVVKILIVCPVFSDVWFVKSFSHSLSDIFFANIFSHSMGSLSILLLPFESEFEVCTISFEYFPLLLLMLLISYPRWQCQSSVIKISYVSTRRFVMWGLMLKEYIDFLKFYKSHE